MHAYIHLLYIYFFFPSDCSPFWINQLRKGLWTTAHQLWPRIPHQLKKDQPPSPPQHSSQLPSPLPPQPSSQPALLLSIQGVAICIPNDSLHNNPQSFMGQQGLVHWNTYKNKIYIYIYKDTLKRKTQKNLLKHAKTLQKILRKCKTHIKTYQKWESL